MAERPLTELAPRAVILTEPAISAAPAVRALSAQSTAPAEVVVGSIEDVQRLEHDWVWLLDAGVVPDPGALAALLAARKQLRAAVVPVSAVLTAIGLIDSVPLPVIAVQDPARVLA